MVSHVNHYENVTEANSRLRNTVVLYDGEPMYIYAITGHDPDGVFRVYMRPITKVSGFTPQPCYDWMAGSNQLGTALDAAMAVHGDGYLVRKMMNSPHFNRFRPFPLGMCNIGTKTVYLERQPLRPKMEQGLTRGMVYETPITTAPYTGEPYPTQRLDMFTEDFEACILGKHPSAEECVSALIDPGVKNEAHAFDRHFAVARGPVGMLFLAYKSDIVGVLPNNNLSEVRLGTDFWHLREVVGELDVFSSITRHP